MRITLFKTDKPVQNIRVTRSRTKELLATRRVINLNQPADRFEHFCSIPISARIQDIMHKGNDPAIEVGGFSNSFLNKRTVGNKTKPFVIVQSPKKVPLMNENVTETKSIEVIDISDDGIAEAIDDHGIAEAIDDRGIVEAIDDHGIAEAIDNHGIAEDIDDDVMIIEPPTPTIINIDDSVISTNKVSLSKNDVQKELARKNASERSTFSVNVADDVIFVSDSSPEKANRNTSINLKKPKIKFNTSMRTMNVRITEARRLKRKRRFQKRRAKLIEKNLRRESRQLSALKAMQFQTNPFHHTQSSSTFTDTGVNYFKYNQNNPSTTTGSQMCNGWKINRTGLREVIIDGSNVGTSTTIQKAEEFKQQKQIGNRNFQDCGSSSKREEKKVAVNVVNPVCRSQTSQNYNFENKLTSDYIPLQDNKQAQQSTPTSSVPRKHFFQRAHADQHINEKGWHDINGGRNTRTTTDETNNLKQQERHGRRNNNALLRRTANNAIKKKVNCNPNLRRQIFNWCTEITATSTPITNTIRNRLQTTAANQRLSLSFKEFQDNMCHVQQVVRTGLREIIIDGSNVAIGHSNNRFFSVKGLQIAIEYFVKKGHKVTAFVPQYRKKLNQCSDRSLLNRLADKGYVVFTPSREVNGKRITPYDDRYIIQYATACEGIVVSSDNYRDLFLEKPEWRETIEKRLLMPTWIGDVLMFPEDPLGRAGPSLYSFLRFPCP